VPEAEQRVELGGPVDVLMAGANELDPTPRGRSLNLLIRASAEPAGGQWGPRGLYDPNPWVQRQAVEALAARLPETESAQALEAFIERADVDPYVRGTAGLRLARIGRTQGLPTLTAAWQGEPEPWRRAPLAAAALAMGDTSALAPLSAVLASGDLPLEVDFVLDLGRAGLLDVVPALREGEKVIEEELRLPYAAARIALGDPSGEGALRRALSSDIVELRLEALDYLTRMREPAATALLRKARSNDSELVRWYAQLALVSRSQVDVDRLSAGYASEDLEVRVMAVRFAGELGIAESLSKRDERVAREVVRLALNADEPTLREAALRALLDLGLDGEEEVLQRNLGNEYLAVRVEAAGALLLLDPQRG